MRKETLPSSKGEKELEGMHITPEAVLHNTLYEPPSRKILNDNKGSLKDTVKKLQVPLLLGAVAVAFIALMSL